MTVDFLEPSLDFQTSINIGYDLNNKKKVESFIPTSSAVSLLETIILSTDNASTNRAHILVGAYGKGKSHIILSILSLLFHKDRNAVSNYLKKADEQNHQLYEYAVEYINSSKRILPVIISGNSTSLTQAFLRALYSTLQENNLISILPKTNFQMAINMIELWSTSYPDVYERLQGLLPMPIKEFKQSLSDFNADAYSTFEKVYPNLTAGNEFNPFTGYDVVDLYEHVCTKLGEHGYSGMYVIYDEFSKYLESSISKASINDIKMLQDFAEKCNRSGNNQLHLLLISHKEIENYIDVLPKQKVDGWRGVSERFSHFVMQSDYSQTYEILGAAIRKSAPQWEKFKAENAEYFKSVTQKYSQSVLFSDCTAEQQHEAFVECYPLHPITTFLLPRISEKVAQNERTLFTFIAGQDASSLGRISIVSENGVPVVTPDYLYDYFAPQMRKEAFTSEVHQLYSLSTEILSQLDEKSLEAKIIKTICLIYGAGQFNILAPTVQTLTDAFSSEDISTDDVLCAIDALIKKHLVVYLKRSNAYLQLKRSSGVDIYAEIRNTSEKRKNVVSPAHILNSANVEPYLYPIRYNDEHTVTRYFSFRFVPHKSVLSGMLDPDTSADGQIIGVLPENENLSSHEVQQIAEHYGSSKQLVLVFPDELASIDSELRMFDAVTLLRGELTDDDNLRNEYDIIYQDLLEVINNYIAQYIHPALHGAQYWHLGKKQAIYRKSNLTELLSAICQDVFPNTPSINNEVLNRNRLSSVAVNSRTKLLSALMQKDLLPNLGLTGSGQDISFMRSTLVITGLLVQNQNGVSLTGKAADDRLTNVLNVISEFFDSTKNNGQTPFADLYEKLTGTEKGIGMRRGLIPIYIAVCLRKYADHYVIRDITGELKLTPVLLNQINESPENYSIHVEEWTDEKETYTAGLSEVFGDFVIDKEKQYGTYSYIALAMNRWYLSLPKYVKEAKQQYHCGEYYPIDKNKRSFLNMLKQSNIGAQELLFVRIPAVFGYDSFCDTLLNEIIEVKNFFDSVKVELENELILDVNSILGDRDNNNGLAANATLWIDSLSEKSKNTLYPNGSERIISLLENPDNDEHLLINRLAKAVSGLRIEDWNDSNIPAFVSRFRQYKETIDSENQNTLHEEEQSVPVRFSNQYAVTFVDGDGNAKLRTFNRTEYSKRAQLLHNRLNSDLRDMGHSITQEEKRQVLMEILESLC